MLKYFLLLLALVPLTLATYQVVQVSKLGTQGQVRNVHPFAELSFVPPFRFSSHDPLGLCARILQCPWFIIVPYHLESNLKVR